MIKHIYNLPVVHLLGKKPVNTDKKLSMWLAGACPQRHVSNDFQVVLEQTY